MPRTAGRLQTHKINDKSATPNKSHLDTSVNNRTQGRANDITDEVSHYQYLYRKHDNITQSWSGLVAAALQPVGAGKAEDGDSDGSGLVEPPPVPVRRYKPSK